MCWCPRCSRWCFETRLKITETKLLAQIVVIIFSFFYIYIFYYCNQANVINYNIEKNSLIRPPGFKEEWS